MKGLDCCLQKLVNISPARIWGLLSNPWRIPILLTLPPVSSSVEAVRFLFPDIPLESIETCRLELLGNDRFFGELNKKMVEKRHRRTHCEALAEVLYMSVRFTRPKVVIETGAFDGESSAVILQALHDNGFGILVSVDLPAREPIKWSTYLMQETTLPLTCQPGWVVPDYLRGHYQLFLGDSRESLPQIFKKYPRVDIFFHDSLHTFEHQYFEYTAVWPHLSEGGLLLSDDIFWNAAFSRFCKEKNKTYAHLNGFAVLKK